MPHLSSHAGRRVRGTDDVVPARGGSWPPPGSPSRSRPVTQGQAGPSLVRPSVLAHGRRETCTDAPRQGSREVRVHVKQTPPPPRHPHGPQRPGLLESRAGPPSPGPAQLGSSPENLRGNQQHWPAAVTTEAPAGEVVSRTHSGRGQRGRHGVPSQGHPRPTLRGRAVFDAPSQPLASPSSASRSPSTAP